MIVFQKPEFEDQYRQLSLRFLKMIKVMDFIAENICDEPKLVVTSILRDDPPYNVHATLHAVDFSLASLKGGKNSGQRIRDIMNFIYKYDYKRPTMECIPTLFHGTAPHIHLQYHENTSSMDPDYLAHIQTIMAFEERRYQNNGGNHV